MIRSANSGDARRIAEIQVASWRAAYRGIFPDDHLDGLSVDQREGVWKEVCQSDAPPLLALGPDMQVVGFCHLCPSRDAAASRVGEITSLYLDPAQWREGFGRQLVLAARSAALARGFSEITLWVLTGNLRARAFYEALEFQPDGAVKQEQRPGFSIDQVRYRWEAAGP